jgi:hypothetical protein
MLNEGAVARDVEPPTHPAPSPRIVAHLSRISVSGSGRVRNSRSRIRHTRAPPIDASTSIPGTSFEYGSVIVRHLKRRYSRVGHAQNPSRNKAWVGRASAGPRAGPLRTSPVSVVRTGLHLAAVRHQFRHVLQMESQIRRAGRLRGEAPQRTGAREQPTQADVRRPLLGECGAEGLRSAERRESRRTWSMHWRACRPPRIGPNLNPEVLL